MWLGEATEQAEDDVARVTHAWSKSDLKLHKSLIVKTSQHIVPNLSNSLGLAKAVV